MADLFFVALTSLFFALAIGLMRFLDRLREEG
ncbi:MAG: hypothetical protein HDKAJFGB_02458 [Anaerolineae bacterium]|nr:hypothetical protein [Anaerolineae bacterium]